MSVFTDALSVAQLATIKAKAQNPRPSYFTQVVQDTQTQTQSDTKVTSTSGYTQIDADLEGFIILLPKATKQRMITFLQQTSNIGVSDNDLQLMGEVLLARTQSYIQVNTDAAAPILSFDRVRGDIASFASSIASNAALEFRPDPVTGVLTSLSTLYNTLNASGTQIGKFDDLAMHDNIADNGIGAYYAISVTGRKEETLSWISIFQLYL